MTTNPKSHNIAEADPFEVGQVTEQIPAWELYEDGIEPVDDEPRAEDRAA